jgi:hypothetical protein
LTVIRGRDLHHRQRGVEQAHVDDLSFARPLAMAERGQRADGGAQRGVPVDHGRRGADGLALELAGQRHEAAHRLTERVERGPVRVGAVLSETRDRRQDDGGIERAPALVVEAHRAHDAGAEVLEHDVGFLHERREDFLAQRVPQIDAHALLAAVVDGEVDALAADHRRMLAGLLVADRLDLDDLGAQVGQQHPAAGTRLKAGQLEDPDAVQAAGHFVART